MLIINMCVLEQRPPQLKICSTCWQHKFGTIRWWTWMHSRIPLGIALERDLMGEQFAVPVGEKVGGPQNSEIFPSVDRVKTMILQVQRFDVETHRLAFSLFFWLFNRRWCPTIQNIKKKDLLAYAHRWVWVYLYRRIWAHTPRETFGRTRTPSNFVRRKPG